VITNGSAMATLYTAIHRAPERSAPYQRRDRPPRAAGQQTHMVLTPR
jgi:hypothetical protein